jgi:hypothetical protein
MLKIKQNQPRSHMKKFITILISCSLALAAGAMAQQEDQQSPPPKKQQAKAHAGKAAPSAEKQQANQPATKPHAGKKAKEPVPASGNAKVKAPAQEPASASTNANAQAGQHKKGRNASKTPVTANKPANPAPAGASAQAGAQAPNAPQVNQPKPGAQKLNAQAKKPDVQAIKAEHANFHAQPRPQQVPSVTFNQDIRISGSEQWQGQQYAAFRSYRPQMHDQGWYRSRYGRVELIGGGYYYFNAGYWYPAWGYAPSAAYYVYDGPIYAGSRAEPPDRVIADVQSSLQAQGYYKGEVDGLLGPLTRQALTGYQSDNGLYTTAAIDEPTLASLGMG